MDDATLHKLADLAQLDTDAVAVYREALGQVDDDETKQALTGFRDEHLHHATVISEALVRLGQKAPKERVDMVGYLAEFVTQVRSLRGTRGALHALRSAEQYHNKRYEAAAAWEIDDEQLKTSILTFYSEEQRHLAYVETQLGVLAAEKS